MERRRVVVTGIGALTPIGNTSQDFWNGLVEGKSGAAPITHFDASKFKTQFACELKGFNIEDFMDRKEARKLDKFAQYASVVSDEAIKDAHLDVDKVDKDRVGVIWGSGIGGLETFQNEVTNFNQGDGTPRFNPFFIPKMIADIASGMISIKYGFRGPNFTTVSACASAANAMIDALNYIRFGYADVIVSGGSEAAVTIAGIGGFNALHALSTFNENPAKASRPFDANRDGFVLGEELQLLSFLRTKLTPKQLGNNITGNLFEALIGAIYLDKGYKTCFKFIERKLILPYINIKNLEEKVISHKSLLIEWCQKHKRDFSFEAEEDVEDRSETKYFVAKVYVEGFSVTRARATSKKRAEESAAKRTCYKIQGKQHYKLDVK